MRNGTSLAGEVAGLSMEMETPAVSRSVTVSSELVQSSEDRGLCLVSLRRAWPKEQPQ